MTDNQKKIIKGWFTNPKSIVLFIYKRFLSRFIKDDEKYLKILYWLEVGKQLNLENPQTFQEKLQWLKLYNRKPEFTQMVDKYEAKKYVASIIGEEFIIPTLGVWDSFAEIDFSKLPDKFVLKCTHDSGRVVMCKDKSTFNIGKALKRINKAMRTNYYLRSREYPYRNVKPRIIAEKYLKDSNSQDLIDYKFYCFGGEAKYCQVIANRTTKETIDFYDREWRHQPFIGLLSTVRDDDVQHADKEQEIPLNYGKMLQIADRISSSVDSPFVRIDLYHINGKIYFGEITFFPFMGLGSFRPAVWNLKMGNMMIL